LQVLEGALEEVSLTLQAQIPGLQLERLPIITTLQGDRLAVESLCNGWVEVTPSSQKAFLPDFRCRRTNDQYAVVRHEAHLLAENTLKKCGFATQWVDMDFPGLARRGGALHCAIKVLERTV
jgi:hypothetical protein